MWRADTSVLTVCDLDATALVQSPRPLGASRRRGGAGAPSVAFGDLLPIPDSAFRTKSKTRQACRVFDFVEVPGIEPGSNGVSRSILRAQSPCGAFGLAGSCDPSANTAYLM